MIPSASVAPVGARALRRHSGAVLRACWPALLAAACLAGAPSLRAAESTAPTPLPLSATQRQALGITLVAPVAASAGARTWPATVVAPASEAQWVAAPVTGLLAALLVDSNQRVRAGDPVATIQSPAVAEAAAAWLQADTQWQLASREAARQQSLLDEGVIPAARVRQAEAAAAQARAQRDAHEARLRLLGLGRPALAALRSGAPLPTVVTLRSPASGVVAELPAAAGQRLEEGAAVARIVRSDRLVLAIRLPAAQASQLRPGAAVRDAQGRRIARLGPPPGAVSAAQTVELRAPLEVADRQAWLLGQSVEVLLDTGEAGWRVPADAVFRIGEGHWVYVERASALVPVAVQPQAREGDGLVVRGPLEPGARVASGDVAALKGAAMGIGAAPAGEAAANEAGSKPGAPGAGSAAADGAGGRSRP